MNDISLPITKDITVVKFPNGFQMIHQKPKHDLPITSIHTFVNAGSALETDGIRGVSHFVEHMCFKGTRKIPQALDIYINYDKIGAYFNAYTEKKYTCYTIKCEDIYVENCTQVLSDMLMNSTYIRKEFIKEKKVVVEENIKNKNDIFSELSDAMESIIYKGSSFEFPIDDISYHAKKDSLEYNKVIDWYNWFYQPKNMVFSIVTHLSIDTVKHILSSSYFMKHSLYHENRILKLKPSFVLPFPNLNLDLKNKMEIYSESKTGISTNHICVGYRTCVYNSPDRYVFKILKHIFNGFSGRLFMTLRENHGVTYSSNVYTQYFENTGYFLIYTQTDPKNTFVNSIHQKSKLGVLPLLLKMCFDIKTKGITSDELETAKGNIKGKYLLNMENNDTLANHNGKNMILYGDNFNNNFVPYSDIYKEKIEKITKKEVNDVIQKYMNPENMVVGIMSSKKIPVNKILSVVNEYL